MYWEIFIVQVKASKKPFLALLKKLSLNSNENITLISKE
jgi:hypothetical protein